MALGKGYGIYLRVLYPMVLTISLLIENIVHVPPSSDAARAV